MTPDRYELQQGALDNVKVQREKCLITIGTITRQLMKYPTSPNLNKDLKMLTSQLSHLDKVLSSFGSQGQVIGETIRGTTL